ncbi:uncharacterized protein LOC103182798 isoform X1 [Callorhinchus milii]|uniref:uncharacterized protein LOC103182798 isoform X1 n=1 Tax=Callorhinchus milii TaxID=7868 RepID=UPI001C3F58ED|nr:uncharacterized protein LOC103182798 isoform X1 [Callorhinchus milii]
MIQKRISAQNYTDVKLKQIWDSRYEQPRQLLASEAVFLFAVVPRFYTYIGKDAGVARILTLATGDINFISKLMSIVQAKTYQEEDIELIIDHVSDYITRKVYKHHHNLRMKTSDLNSGPPSFVLMASKALPRKPVSKSLHSADHLHQGIRSSPYRKSPMGSSAKTPALGDYILTEPQVMGRITCLPEPYVAEIQMDAVVGNNSCLIVHRLYNSKKHYIYVDLSEMEWDEYLGCWKPQGAKGDRITLTCPGEECEADEITESRYEVASTCGRLNRNRKPVKLSPPLHGTSGTETSLRPLSASFRDKIESRIDWTGKADSILKMELWMVPEMGTTAYTCEESEEAEADILSMEGVSKAMQADAQFDDKQDEGTQIEISKCERGEIASLDTDSLLRMGQITATEIPNDWNISTTCRNLEVKHPKTDNLGENLETSEQIKQMNKEDRQFTQSFAVLFPKEKYKETEQKCKRLESSSSYQESRIEGWKSGILGTPRKQRSSVKSAGYKVQHFSLQDQHPRCLSVNNWLKDFSKVQPSTRKCRPSTSKSRPLQTTYFLQQSGSYKKKLPTGCLHGEANRQQLKSAWAQKKQIKCILLSMDMAQPSLQHDKPEMSAFSRQNVNHNGFLVHVLKSLIPKDSK